jgi:hypothetical protein
MEPQTAVDDRLRKALIQLGVWRMFMENVRQQNKIGIMVYTASHAFTWGESPQNHGYWEGIYEKTVEIDPKLDREIVR